IRVELDLAKIKALSLPLNTVLDSIRNANVNLPAGQVTRGRYEVTIRTPGEFVSVDEIASTIVAVRQGGPIRLRDIAQVLDTHEEITRITRIDGERGVRLAIRKQSDANTAEVAQSVLDE